MAKTLEDDFQELEEIIAKMEEEGVPLEESFKLYEKGMKKLKSANEKIAAVEQRIAELKEQLSAFRRSDNQNTWKPGIMIQSALDWLNLIVAAKRQGKILRTQQDFEIACQGWHDLMKPHMLSMKEKFVGDLQGSFDTFMAEIEAVEQHDYDGVVELAAANMGQVEKNLLHAGNEIS